MTFKYNNVYINETSTVVGPYEAKGPISKYFDKSYDDLYFKVVNPEGRKNANYMMRDYFTGKGAGIKYTLDLNPEINIINLNEAVTVNLKFNGIKLDYYSQKFLRTNKIYFYIYGYLFKPMNDTKVILIDGMELANLMIEYNLGVAPLHSYELKIISQLLVYYETEQSDFIYSACSTDL